MSIRRTKIVATLGPATDDPEMLEKIIRAGVDVVRLNFSHGDAETHRNRAEMVRSISAKYLRHVAILVDLQGPKIRIARFRNKKVILEKGAPFVLDINLPSEAGDETQVGISYPQLATDVKPGDVLMLDDGRIELGVDRVDGGKVICHVRVGGELSNNKGINLQGGGLSAAALTDKDKADIKTAAEIDADYVAVSFPRSAADIEEARQLLNAAGCKAGIVAKIERAEAIEPPVIDEIIKASDVIMVARGDLGVEIGDARLPGVQKDLITRSRALNRVVITATQMMESMIQSPLPTRAEVCDVANAVFDGTDAVMLSAETASGQYPDKAVEAMDRVCLEAEQHPKVRTSTYRAGEQFQRIDEAIAMATMYAANHLNVKAIGSLTESGSTPLWMSRTSSGIPIFALTPDKKTCTRVTLFRGVYPLEFAMDTEDHYALNQAVIDEFLRRDLVDSDDDLVILTKGDLRGVLGGTNAMKIVRVGDVRSR
jgi:pyruvate kinase